MCLKCEFMEHVKRTGVSVRFIESAVVIPDGISDELRENLEKARDAWDSLTDRTEDTRLCLVFAPESATELWNSGAKAQFTRLLDDEPWRP